MDLVLRAMLEEFDKGDELLRMIETGKRATGNIIDIGIITVARTSHVSKPKLWCCFVDV